MLSNFSSKIFEIGFNAGHSACCFLYANRNVKLTCIDIGVHKYVQPCFEYLKKMFGSRIKLIIGSSTNILDILGPTHFKTFDCVHVDGNHLNLYYVADTLSMLRYMTDRAYFIMDDTQCQDINNFCDYLKCTPLFEEYTELLPTQLYKHRIFKFHRPNIGIVTLAYGDTYRELVKACITSKKQWAQKFNYNIIEDFSVVDSSRSLSWSKIPLIKKYLPVHDYLVWLDADTLILNNNQTLDELLLLFPRDKCFLMGRDFNNINAGVFIVKNDKMSLDILNEVYSQTQFINHVWLEQMAMIYLFLDTKKHRMALEIVGEEHINVFNSYTHNYQKGDFLIHFAGIQGTEMLKLINNYKEKIVNPTNSFDCWKAIIKYIAHRAHLSQ